MNEKYLKIIIDPEKKQIVSIEDKTGINAIQIALILNQVAIKALQQIEIKESRIAEPTLKEKRILGVKNG